MSKHIPIVERLLKGEILDVGRINDEVASWHKTDSPLPLHDWLGFTEEEYALFVERPSSVRYILAARARGKNVRDVLEQTDQDLMMAARGASLEEANGLREWLRSTGRL